ncbi:CPII coat sec24 protein [Mycena vulgaris]|nr:CPII coat sec24 protein [Mycena vulgaris]
MSLPRAPKRRQYAPGERHVYYGSQSLADTRYPGQHLTDDIQDPSQDQQHPTATDNDAIPEPRHVDLTAYPPSPHDLRLPPPQIRLPPGSFCSASSSESDSHTMIAGLDLYQYQSCTLTAIPTTPSLLHAAKIPLGLVLTPHRTLAVDEAPIPTAPYSSAIARCEACRAYINPYVQFIDGGNRWRCSLCATPNDFLAGFDASHPALTHPAVDFLAPPEYARAAPQARAHVFLLDVSQEAMRSGMFAAAIHTIAENLGEILITGLNNTKVALVCFDASLYFFALPPGAAAFSLLVVSDIEGEDTFLPRPTDLLVPLSDTRAEFDALLALLPTIFAASPPNPTPDSRSGSATGPALAAALALIAPTGGEIVLLCASVPSRGKGALALDSATPEAKRDGQEPDPDASKFYHALALACVEACVSVDVFVCGERYRGVATLALLPHYTAGQTFYYPAFNGADPEDRVKFGVELGRVLASPIWLEAEMRVRCSRGISVKSMHGNFFLQGTDRAVLPAVPLDQSYAVELHIDAPLVGPLALFQTALLHTTSSGERCIRVLTLALPTTSVISEVFESADVSALTTLVAKQIVQRPSVLSLEDKRNKLLRLLADLCAAYAAATGSPASKSEAEVELALLLPVNLKMLPILLLGLFKKIATRLDTELALDMRAYTRLLLTSAIPAQLIRYIYPNVYCLHNMPADVGFPDAGGALRMPAPLPLTSAWWEPHGLYLLDDGQLIYLWVGRAAVPQLVADVFGAEDYAALRGGKVQLPELNTAISQRVRTIVGEIRARVDVVHYPSVCIVKDDSTSGAPRAAAVQMLIHDRADELRISYRQFLVKIYGKVR